MAAIQVLHINPETMHRNPAFTQVVTVEGPAKLIYVGGQDAVDASGAVVGKGDLRAQAEQVLRNLRFALQAAQADLQHIIKWNVYLVQGQPLRQAFEVFQGAMRGNPKPPAITVTLVSGLANPEFLLEMDAVAVVPGTG